VLRRFFRACREVLTRYFVAGVLAFAPIGITIWAIGWIVQRLDNLLLPRLLGVFQPGLEAPPSVPFLGALFTLVVILLFGVIARHFFGWELVRLWERLLLRVPIARSIYGAVKQLVEAIFGQSNAQSFRRVVMLEYPRKGLYALAFTTGEARGIVQAKTPERMVNCFVPTTPNPTSGFYLLVPEHELTELEMTVEDAFKLVMSAGLVHPVEASTPAPEAPALPLAAPVPQQGS